MQSYSTKVWVRWGRNTKAYPPYPDSRRQLASTEFFPKMPIPALKYHGLRLAKRHTPSEITSFRKYHENNMTLAWHMKCEKIKEAYRTYKTILPLHVILWVFCHFVFYWNLIEKWTFLRVIQSYSAKVWVQWGRSAKAYPPYPDSRRQLA